jgi:hypothetical protein
MNHPLPAPRAWTRRRFWAVTVILFVLQGGLLFLFASRNDAVMTHSVQPCYFRLIGTPLTAGQLTRMFFAVDPTVFPLPSRHGFSDRAWLGQPPPQFEVPNETEGPAWLALDPARLGTNFPHLNRPRHGLPVAPATEGNPQVEPWPAFMSPEEFRSQSAFEIVGELAARQLNAPAGLPPETNAQLLSNSVVQIAVDGAGQVVAARLLERSGSVNADLDALHGAQNLRFRPASSPAPVWGEAIFEWQTVAPANAAGIEPIRKGL